MRDVVTKARPHLRTFEVDNFSHLHMRPVKTAPAGVPVIGTLGRLHEQKGFDILIRAAAGLNELGIDYRLKIAGDGRNAPPWKPCAMSWVCRIMSNLPAGRRKCRIT